MISTSQMPSFTRCAEMVARMNLERMSPYECNKLQKCTEKVLSPIVAT